jgi:TetR/AcrR family transcriptional repressor of nem operon
MINNIFQRRLAMAYPDGHNEEVRRRILREARKAFNLHGFGGVTIDQVMTSARLTRGAFYFHFKSKTDLYRQSIAFVLDEHPVTAWADDLQNVSPSRNMVDAYLSDRHLCEADASCPLVTHAAEAARGDRAIRSTFADVLRALIETINRDLGARKIEEDKGMVIAAICVGSLSLARGVDSPELARHILRAARSSVYSLAGWGLPTR